MKLLERANTEHVQKAIEHEQVALRANALRAQLDIYKKQVREINWENLLHDFIRHLLKLNIE